MEKAVIFDIDGVLAKKSPDRDYREYDKVDLDSPVEAVFEILNRYLFDEDYVIIFITGRKESCKIKTMNFIAENTELDFIYNSTECNGESEQEEYFLDNFKLYMREDNDNRKAEVLKKEIYDKHIKGEYEVVLVFEDDPVVCEMYKKEGLLVLQPHTRD